VPQRFASFSKSILRKRFVSEKKLLEARALENWAYASRALSMILGG